MGKQFIERNQVVIGVITAILTVITLVASLAVQREDLTGGYVIDVEFTDANGLEAGDIAIVAGIRAGKIIDIDIVEDRIVASVQMDGAVDLPTTTRASITVRTLVGKKAIDLDTGNSFGGPFLRDGDTIGLDRTSVTIDVPALAETAEDFLTEIDSDALNTLLVAVSDVTRDQRDEVANLVASGNDLTTLVNDQEEQIRELLRNLSALSTTLQSRDDQLVGVIDDLAVAFRNINDRRADIQDLLIQTQNTSAVTADFISRVRADLDAVLLELHLDLEIVRRHQLDIAEGIAYSGDALVGFGSIGFAGEVPVPWGHVFVTSLGPAGLDVLVGCGGLVDQQIDLILGPDPRSCQEQGVTGTPGDQPGAPNTDPTEQPASTTTGGLLAPDLVSDLPDGAVMVGSPQLMGFDMGPRSLIAVLEADG